MIILWWTDSTIQIAIWDPRFIGCQSYCGYHQHVCVKPDFARQFFGPYIKLKSLDWFIGLTRVHIVTLSHALSTANGPSNHWTFEEEEWMAFSDVKEWNSSIVPHHGDHPVAMVHSGYRHSRWGGVRQRSIGLISDHILKVPSLIIMFAYFYPFFLSLAVDASLYRQAKNQECKNVFNKALRILMALYMAGW